MVAPLAVSVVLLGATGAGHWSACAKTPVANALLKVAEADEMSVLVGDVGVG